MNPQLLELKQYVFAAYLGQKVMKWQVPQPPEDTEFTEVVTGSMLEAYSHDCYLHLFPISSITEDKAIELNKFNGNNIAIWPFKNKDYWIKELEFRLRENILDYQFYQYLQQQSFALPIYFKGEHYSVERLVELGIITLKS